MMKIVYKTIPAILATFVLVGCAVRTEPADPAPTPVEITVTEQSEAEEESTADAYDYMEYIPVIEGGTEKNLYDMIGGKSCFVYLRREDCKDCQRDEASILDHLSTAGYPVIQIETLKDPAGFEGLCVASKTVKKMGIKEIPAVCFVIDGTFRENLQNVFQDDCELLDKTIDRLYN